MRLLGLFLLLSLATSCDPGAGPTPPPPAAETRSTAEARATRPEGLGEALVLRVVDGDTIELQGGTKVRYIGIDTPETVHPRKPVEPYGPEASAANKRLVEGQVVGLEFDVQRKDKYGRTLAYVWVGDTFVNAWLAEQGLAQVSTYPPNVKYVSLFTALQREAAQAGRGVWGGTPPSSPPSFKVTQPARGPPTRAGTVYGTRTGKRYHRGSCGYLRSSKIPMSRSEATTRGLTPCKRCW